MSANRKNVSEGDLLLYRARQRESYKLRKVVSRYASKYNKTKAEVKKIDQE